MNGTEYVALVRLSNKANETTAMPGETCERVAESSLPWLAEQGLIKSVAEIEAEREAAERAAAEAAAAAPATPASDDVDDNEDGRFERVGDGDDDEEQE